MLELEIVDKDNIHLQALHEIARATQQCVSLGGSAARALPKRTTAYMFH
jgi:hypothetical protein